MPTAAKLVAALAFAFLGFVTAEFIKPLMPEGTQFGYFSPYCAAVGGLCGWFVMGSLASEQSRRTWESGIRTTVTMVFWCVLGLSIYEMTLQSMKLRYDGPIAALQGMFEIALEYLVIMVNAAVLGTLFVGGLIAAHLTRWAAQRWR